MTADTVELIRARHRTRRYAMKLQQKIDRALESFVRRNRTEWNPELDEAARKRANAEVIRIIAAARKGEGDDEIVAIVVATDASRKPADAMRKGAEKEMERLAEQLPVFAWVDTIRGAGALGLATIVAEAGPLDRYPNPAKLWKRLGFAPYDGHAGSTWKRDTWRPRKLSAEEWIDNPFSGERYALMFQIATWLVNAQWIAAGKTEDGQGRPNGPYGEIYAKRRARTAVTHPDWSKGHARQDALRVTMKRFLADLWEQWNSKRLGHRTIDAHCANAESPAAAGHQIFDAHWSDARRRTSTKPKPGHAAVDAHHSHAGSTAAGHTRTDAQPNGARRRPSRASKETRPPMA